MGKKAGFDEAQFMILVRIVLLATGVSIHFQFLMGKKLLINLDVWGTKFELAKCNGIHLT